MTGNAARDASGDAPRIATRIATRIAVLAFDGIVADTLPLRAQLLAEAIEAEHAATPSVASVAQLIPLLPGRTFSETVAIAMEQLPTLRESAVRGDLTLHDIIALRAQRAWTAASAHGVPLREGIVDWIHRETARGVRIVLRSDSQRREVEPLLRLAGLEDHIVFLRASDDLPRAPGLTTLQASYEAIDARLTRQGIERSQRIAIEVSSVTAEVAGGYAAASRETF